MRYLRVIPPWVVFTAAGIGAVSLVILSLVSVAAWRDSANTTVEASEVVVTEAALYVHLLDAETNQRAYVLTGDETFLAAHQDSMSKIPQTLQSLETQLAGDERQRASMESIRQNVDAKVAEMNRAVQLVRDGRRDEAVALVSEPAGQQYKQDTLTAMQNIHGVEAERHLAARSTANSRADQGLIAVSLLGVVVAGGLVWAFYSLRRRGVEEGLRQLNREKDEFLGMVSHELRTPITVIMGNANLLRRKWDTLTDAQRASALTDIEDESNRMHGVVANMLRLSRPERDSDIELEPVLLSRTIERAVRRHQGRYPEPKVLFDTARDVHPVMAHEDYLSQVIENLLSNAAKYGSRTEPIEVEVREAGDRVEVAVMDRGPGIDRKRRQHIFQPFVRLPGSGRSKEGLGLGLPICRMLMRAQDGEIAVSERPGGGAVFTITLQRAEALHDEAGESAPEMALAESR